VGLRKPNIGIITGAESGIVVLDVDPRHSGDKTLADLEAKFGALPKTWRFFTGGGGLHILFRHPGGYVQSKPGAVGPGLDCKADGGFIVAPPSLHESGRHYAIDPTHHPDDVQIASSPDWLRDILARQQQRRARQQQRRSIRAERTVRPSNGLSRYGEAALDNACRRILAAANGSQEVTINAEVYSMGRLGGAGALPADFALRALQYAAAQVVSFSRPWSSSQLAAKVERSFAAGTANPRSVRRC
jgi:hypothetical protein